MWNSGRLPSMIATVSPSADPELRQASCHRVDAREQLRPGQRHAVVGGADGDDVRMVGGGAPKRFGHGRGVNRSRPPPA